MHQVIDDGTVTVISVDPYRRNNFVRYKLNIGNRVVSIDLPWKISKREADRLASMVMTLPYDQTPRY